MDVVSGSRSNPQWIFHSSVLCFLLASKKAKNELNLWRCWSFFQFNISKWWRKNSLWNFWVHKQKKLWTRESFQLLNCFVALFQHTIRSRMKKCFHSLEWNSESVWGLFGLLLYLQFKRIFFSAFANEDLKQNYLNMSKVYSDQSENSLKVISCKNKRAVWLDWRESKTSTWSEFTSGACLHQKKIENRFRHNLVWN